MKDIVRGMVEGLFLSAIFVPFAWFLYVGGEDIIDIIKDMS
jgi:hypothetical protein